MSNYEEKHDEFTAKFNAITDTYRTAYNLTQRQIDNAQENVNTFDLPDDEFSDKILEAYESCLGGEAA